MHTHPATTSDLGTWSFAFKKRPWTWYRPAGRFTFAFVRHPLKWYQSRWAYRMENGWEAGHPMDDACHSEDFNKFIAKLLNWRAGYLSDVYDQYCGPESAPISYVGRQERLADDLIEALRLAGERFDEEAIRTTPRENVTAGLDRWKSLSQYDPVLKSRILQAESRAMKRFGYRAEDV